MFELYTEKARRTIFFGRYEASEFSSPYIDTEHLLLGLLREDKMLAQRFLHSSAAVDAIRQEIARRSVHREKTPTSVDLPMSAACRRVLAYGAEEAERLGDKYISTEHLLLGMLRAEKCLAAELLGEHGLTLDSVRTQLAQSKTAVAQSGSGPFVRLEKWFAEREARGGWRVVRRMRGANRAVGFAVYAAERANRNEQGENVAVHEKVAEIQKRIDFAIERMENAIANHEFEKARHYSSEHRQEVENLRLVYEQFHLAAPGPPVPLLCVEVVRDESFVEVQKRCDACLAEGFPEVWLLQPDLKRAYTVSKAEGLRECREGILRMGSPAVEMDWKTIFD